MIRISSHRSRILFTGLFSLVAALSLSCLNKEDPVMWSPEVKERIHKVKIAELMADFRVEAERIRTASPPQAQLGDWTTRQSLQGLLRKLNESMPGDMFEIDENLNRVGLVASWYELTDSYMPVVQQSPEWVVWIHEPFGQYSGRGMYFFRMPHGNKLSAGLPAGFENNPLTESAVELFLRSSNLVTLAINTPSRPPAGKAAPNKLSGSQLPLYQAYVETWLSTGDGVFWLDLCTYPRAPAASENLYLGAVTIATNGNNKPLTGRAAEFRKKLLDAGLDVETLGDGFEAPGLVLPPYTATLARYAKQSRSEYLLLAFPTTALEKPQQWEERLGKALPDIRFTPSSPKPLP